MPSPDSHLETEFDALIERIGRNLSQSVPPTPSDPEIRPSDAAFKRELAKTIETELAANAAAPLRAALAARIKSAENSVGARLCALGEDTAVAVLTGAIDNCLKRAPRGDAGRDLRTSAQRLLGWLLLRFVREEWTSEEQETANRQAVSVRVDVGSEAGAEVLWARWRGDDEPPEFKVIGPKLVGKRNLLTDAKLAEQGWEDWSRYVDDAKAALWVAMLGEQAPDEFGRGENERLRKNFAHHCEAFGGSRYYLTVRDDDLADPLAQPQVLNALRLDLGLPVLSVSDAPEDRFFSISETMLQDMIRQCLKTLKDHGDD